MVEKLRAYLMLGIWQQRMLQPENTSQQMLLLKDVGGGRFLRYCDIDMSFPESIRRRQKQLTELGLIKDHLARIDELRTVNS